MQLTPLQRRVKHENRALPHRPASAANFQKFCFPTQYRVQPMQKFVAEYMAPHGLAARVGINTLLAYHEIGAGKTCAAIQIAEQWLPTHGAVPVARRPIVVMPASLISGFRAELRTPCATEYVSAADRHSLAHLPVGSQQARDIIAAANEKINSRYRIMSYNMFARIAATAAPPPVPCRPR